MDMDKVIVVSKFNTGALGSREMSIITEVVENIVQRSRYSFPKFYKGNDWYMNMLISSEELDNDKIDKVLSAYSAAWEIVDEYIGWDVGEMSRDEILALNHSGADPEYLEAVKVEDGVIYFMVEGIYENWFELYE